jgi:hypothetical protein
MPAEITPAGKVFNSATPNRGVIREKGIPQVHRDYDFVKASAPRAQTPYPVTPHPKADVKRPRPAQRVGASSLWSRRKQKIDLIESRADAPARWFLLLTKIAEDIGDREVDRAIDGAINADSDAIRLLDLVGAVR